MLAMVSRALTVAAAAIVMLTLGSAGEALGAARLNPPEWP